MCKFSILTILLLGSLLGGFAQDPAKSPAPIGAVRADDEILRVDTNLIQIGISVVDKKGKFVEGLKQSDFELLVDGKPVTTLFFNESGFKNSTERAQSDATSGPVSASPLAINEFGRTIAFVVDDLHMSAESLIRTRRLIQKFLDQQVRPNDMVAIVSSSNKVGFL
ncbi:MAG TPA: hypothetical protein VNA17_07500, partial [Pyrinomonadaceae bacterium]|nr:hypothetical protein [Pyrinomonadaceae bacterium]